MTKEEAIVKLNKVGYIYGYMYGRPLENNKEILQINAAGLNIWDSGFCFVWGWPGPDYNLYKYEDYGKTWAFTKEEVKED